MKSLFASMFFILLSCAFSVPALAVVQPLPEPDNAVFDIQTQEAVVQQPQEFEALERRCEVTLAGLAEHKQRANVFNGNVTDYRLVYEVGWRTYYQL